MQSGLTFDLTINLPMVASVVIAALTIGIGFGGIRTELKYIRRDTDLLIKHVFSDKRPSCDD